MGVHRDMSLSGHLRSLARGEADTAVGRAPPHGRTRTRRRFRVRSRAVREGLQARNNQEDVANARDDARPRGRDPKPGPRPVGEAPARGARGDHPSDRRAGRDGLPADPGKAPPAAAVARLVGRSCLERRPHPHRRLLRRVAAPCAAPGIDNEDPQGSLGGTPSGPRRRPRDASVRARTATRVRRCSTAPERTRSGHRSRRRARPSRGFPPLVRVLCPDRAELEREANLVARSLVVAHPTSGPLSEADLVSMLVWQAARGTFLGYEAVFTPFASQGTTTRASIAARALAIMSSERSIATGFDPPTPAWKGRFERHEQQ